MMRLPGQTVDAGADNGRHAETVKPFGFAQGRLSKRQTSFCCNLCFQGDDFVPTASFLGKIHLFPLASLQPFGQVLHFVQDRLRTCFA